MKEFELEQVGLLMVLIVIAFFDSALLGRIGAVIGIASLITIWYVFRIFKQIKIISRQLQGFKVMRWYHE